MAVCCKTCGVHTRKVQGSSQFALNACFFFSKVICCFNAICVQDGVQLGYEVEVQSAGQCDVSLRHDGRIFATGGWDNRQVNDALYMCCTYVIQYDLQNYCCWSGTITKYVQLLLKHNDDAF